MDLKTAWNNLFAVLDVPPPEFIPDVLNCKGGLGCKTRKFMRETFIIEGDYVIYTPTGKMFPFSKPEFFNNEQLNELIATPIIESGEGGIKCYSVFGKDIGELVKEVNSEKLPSTVQLASQDNYLEVINPDLCCWCAIIGLFMDKTQGPLGTIPTLPSYIGLYLSIPDEEIMFNALKKLDIKLENSGYLLPDTVEKLNEVTEKIVSGIDKVETMTQLRRIPETDGCGIQTVSVSAFPSGYLKINRKKCSDVIDKIEEERLYISYLLTFKIHILKYVQGHCNENVHVTFPGGGVFRNEPVSICNAFIRAIKVAAELCSKLGVQINLHIHSFKKGPIDEMIMERLTVERPKNISF